MDSRFYWQIHQLAFLLEKRADTALKTQLGIGFAQYKVLEAINQNMLTKQNVVAELLDQTEASVSRQVTILKKKGLIVVNVVMGNKRAKELSLTRVGDDVVRQAEDILDVTQAQITGSVSYQEQRLVSELIDRMLSKAKKT